MSAARIAGIYRQTPRFRVAVRIEKDAPNLGRITIPIATVIALPFLPADPSRPGSLFLPAWILTVGILGGVLGDVLRGGARLAFRAQNILMFGVVLIVYVELLQAGYLTEIDDKAVRNVFLAIALFTTSLALGSSIAPPRLPRTVLALAGRHYSPTVLLWILIASTALALTNFLVTTGFSIGAITDGLLAGRYDTPWVRGQLGGWDAFRDFLSYFGYATPTLTVLLAIRLRSWFRVSVLFGILCSALVLVFIATEGGRRNLVGIGGAAMLTWFVHIRKQIKLKHFFLIASIAMVCIIGLDIILVSRTEGYSDFSYTRSDFQGLRVDDNFTYLGQTMRLIPAQNEFVGFRLPWFMLVRPIPRILWQGKPIDPGFDLAATLGAKGVSFSNSVIGECYMSFGWVGIVCGGVFLGWLSRVWSQLIEHEYGATSIALYGLGVMAMFIGIRSWSDLIFLTYPILCWYALDRVIWAWIRHGSEMQAR